MKINATEIRVGMILEYKEDLWEVLKTNHVKPGKGGAFAQLELKDLSDGTKLNERFRATESIERVILNEIECTYLYKENGNFIFMHGETYEQFLISEKILDNQEKFLIDGMIVTALFHENNPISISLPDNVILEVTEADAVIKGQTASSSYKPAILENGIRIMVPPHIEKGTKIVVKTFDCTYLERAKD